MEESSGGTRSFLRPRTFSSRAGHAAGLPEDEASVRPACFGLDVEVFYGPEVDLREENDEEKHERERKALAVCEGCPVQTECLHWALTNHENWGIWGWMTAPERKLFRKYLNKKKGAGYVPAGSALQAHAHRWIAQHRDKERNKGKGANTRVGPLTGRSGRGRLRRSG